jgi:hypothetical protein
VLLYATRLTGSGRPWTRTVEVREEQSEKVERERERERERENERLIAGELVPKIRGRTHLSNKLHSLYRGALLTPTKAAHWEEKHRARGTQKRGVDTQLDPKRPGLAKSYAWMSR